MVNDPEQLDPVIICPVMGAAANAGWLNMKPRGPTGLYAIYRALRKLGLDRPYALTVLGIAPLNNGFDDLSENLRWMKVNLRQMAHRFGDHEGDSGVLSNGTFNQEAFDRLISFSSDGRTMSEDDFGKLIHALVRDRFRCVHRGQIAAKGKGELDMYFVEAPISDERGELSPATLAAPPYH